MTTEPNSAVVAADAIVAIARDIDLADRSAIASYGHAAQRKLAEYAGQVLAHARERPTAAKDLLGELIETARGLDAGAIGNGSLLERLFSSVETRLKRFVGRFESTADKVETVAIQLESHRDQLLKDIALLDTLFDETRAAIAELELYIAAGKQFVAQSPSIVADGDDALDMQDVHDRRMALARLEKRLLQLEQARQVGLQQLPQIRVVQASDETLVDNLQSAVTLTIPVWKQKMLLLLGLANQESALKLHDAVTSATNKMIEQASSMTHDQAVRIEQSSQSGMLDIGVLERTNRELIETITKVMQIQSEGAAARQVLENRLKAMNQELRASLAGFGSSEPAAPAVTAEPAAANA